MGRYYSGDIDGKFWFAVQSSTAADRFGVEGSEPNYLDYYFNESDLEAVEDELKVIEDSLGKYKKLLGDRFNKDSWYNDESLMEEFNISKEEVESILVNYADLELGIKIRDCIIEEGQCSFEAEL